MQIRSSRESQRQSYRATAVRLVCGSECVCTVGSSEKKEGVRKGI